ncbi:hypothetical protein MVEG_10487 [Podila verticillata NRRL 6337]|nr:hypothetical protein MVEG_10487 [Podila verticillata NRRL 6337]
MTAGSGIVHSEMPIKPQQTRAHEPQLWINLPKECNMCEPSTGGLLDEEIKRATPQDGDIVKMDKNKTAEQSILASYTDMLKGTAYIGDDEFKDRYSTLCPSLRMVTDMVKIRTKDEESHFVLIAGEPLHKSLAQLGPFVMNTK